MSVKKKKNKRYIKSPYSDNGAGLKNKEKQAFSIINKLIKKRNKTDGFHNKGFAKVYAFSGHQVKEIVSSHLYIMYASFDKLLYSHLVDSLSSGALVVHFLS